MNDRDLEKIVEQEKERIEKIRERIKNLTQEIESKKSNISNQILNLSKTELGNTFTPSAFSEIQNMLLETITKGYETIIQEKEKIINKLQNEVNNLIDKYEELKTTQNQQISRVSTLSLEKDKSLVDMLKKIAELETENKNLKDQINILSTQTTKTTIENNIKNVMSHLNLIVDFVTEMLRYFRTTKGIIEEAINIAKEEIEENSHLYKELEIAQQEFSKMINILITTKEKLKLQAVNITKVDLKTVISDVLYKFRTEFNNKNIEVIEEISEEEFIVEVDYQILTDILSEIITNSIESFSQISARNTINIKLQKTQNKKILLTIKDNGCGIPEHLTSKIFKLFFTTKQETGHFGLGLFKTTWFLKMFNANISLHSVFNQGTNVIIEWDI